MKIYQNLRFLRIFANKILFLCERARVMRKLSIRIFLSTFATLIKCNVADQRIIQQKLCFSSVINTCDLTRFAIVDDEISFLVHLLQMPSIVFGVPRAFYFFLLDSSLSRHLIRIGYFIGHLFVV